MRRWAALPLEDSLKALEEMEKVARELSPGGREKGKSRLHEASIARDRPGKK